MVIYTDLAVSRSCKCSLLPKPLVRWLSHSIKVGAESEWEEKMLDRRMLQVCVWLSHMFNFLVFWTVGLGRILQSLFNSSVTSQFLPSYSCLTHVFLWNWKGWINPMTFELIYIHFDKVVIQIKHIYTYLHKKYWTLKYWKKVDSRGHQRKTPLFKETQGKKIQSI